MDVWRRIGIAIGLAGTLLLGGVGCISRPDTQVRGYRGTPPQTMPEAQPEKDPAKPPGSEGFRIPVHSNTPEGRELCDRMILASEGILADAQIIDNRDLHVVLGSKANPDDLPALMRTLVLIMHHSFPEENVTVRAYDRSGRVLVLATVDVQEGTVTYSFP
ncbi:MAG TPA: hypothetical protein PLU39_16830 [Armatimonadota bacterium]|jgi:hypothetical protein|nr:hypothetical protein [Armatimonadota bacterium]HOJ21883.1 hypothetical protein [Armatimonadota bacterium]HOM80208.1 hypothetical protein [Armatimonadota bacterium]HPO73975.1 hypothetical protein [Armatimonadota bacterium]HPT99528.1 hypothetical protein [Armatimonadota bacterium]